MHRLNQRDLAVLKLAIKENCTYSMRVFLILREMGLDIQLIDSSKIVVHPKHVPRGSSILKRHVNYPLLSKKKRKCIFISSQMMRKILADQKKNIG